MKINKLAKSMRRRAAVLALLALIITSVVAMLFITSTSPFAKPTPNKPKPTAETSYRPPTTQQLSGGASIKEDSMVAANDEPTQTPLYPVITSTNVANEKLLIRTLLNTVTSTGGCTLFMKSESGKTYTQRADIQALSSNSTCKGFDIPLDSLSRSESWHVTLTVTSGSSKGIAEQDVAL